jgi:hypothetical protein
MSWQVPPNGGLAAAHVAPALWETLRTGTLQFFDQLMFWLMTATRFASKGLADTEGSVPAFTRTSETTYGEGDGDGVGWAVGVAVDEEVAAATGSTAGEAVSALVKDSGRSMAEGVAGADRAEKEVAAPTSPSAARARHALMRTAIVTWGLRPSDPLGRPRC